VRQKKGQQSIGKSRGLPAQTGGWTTKIHSVVADESTPLVRSLSAGDSPEGQKLMEAIPPAIRRGKPLLMDKAYEGDECRKKARKCKMRPVVPPKSNRKKTWRYSKNLYKRRNVVERNFRKIRSSGECSPDTTNWMKHTTLLSQSQTSPSI
jgi:transposase